MQVEPEADRCFGSKSGDRPGPFPQDEEVMDMTGPPGRSTIGLKLHVLIPSQVVLHGGLAPFLKVT